MIDPQHLIFIHGLYGSSQGFKSTHLRSIFPDMLTPDFPGSLEERLEQLESLLGQETGWRVIGSSLGGLMGANYTAAQPEKVDQLVLLAPALIWPDFAENPPAPVAVPTVIYHGRNDELIPAEAVRPLAQKVFTNLRFNLVDDDHGMRQTVQEIDWVDLLAPSAPE